VLRKLGGTPGQIDDTAAMAFFMIGAVHVALMFMVLKVAGTMVAGWEVFGLAHRTADDGERPLNAAAARPAPAAATAFAAPAQAFASPAPSRDIRVARGMLPPAANDIAGADASARRETRIVAGAPAAAAAASGGQPTVSRVRGIGSRFRSAPPKTGPIRPTEKFR